MWLLLRFVALYAAVHGSCLIFATTQHTLRAQLFEAMPQQPVQAKVNDNNSGSNRRTCKVRTGEGREAGKGGGKGEGEGKNSEKGESVRAGRVEGEVRGAGKEEGREVVV